MLIFEYLFLARLLLLSSDIIILVACHFALPPNPDLARTGGTQHIQTNAVLFLQLYFSENVLQPHQLFLTYISLENRFLHPGPKFFKAFARRLRVRSFSIISMIPGIQFTQQTGSGSDTGMCHSGQAQRSAGISSFRARAGVREIPAFRCPETGMTALMQECAVVRWSD